MAKKNKPSLSLSHFVGVVVFSLFFVPKSVLGVKQELRFGKNGEFKILQVADMHFADGKTTPCLDVFPNQMRSCSDLNTTAFVERMIQAEKPDFIVFTGTLPSALSYFFFFISDSKFMLLVLILFVYV
jgi:predicted MPP superfamily phosphohydrolase